MNTETMRIWGTVASIGSVHVEIVGLGGLARIGDILRIGTLSGGLEAEVLHVNADTTLAILFSAPSGIQVGDRVKLVGAAGIFPDEQWLGRVLDANGKAAASLPGSGLATGTRRELIAPPPNTSVRRLLGPRLATGLMAFDTVLPIRRGQRLGIFAGSGVGKSTLLGKLASSVDADCVVLGLIGERSREVREFAETVLSPETRARTVIIAATSNESPSMKKRAAYTAMATAEFFRDQGKNVLLVIDSLTRFAEAHREAALLAGETPALNAFPTSTVRVISELVERAGTGGPGQGDITALFSVLVAGSDFEEPVADMVRGILDGHIILDRAIAERGRFPAIDITRSVSRALPQAASESENRLIARFKRLIAKYQSLELLVRANMYQFGQDEEGDRAIALYDGLDGFLGEENPGSIGDAFTRLEAVLAQGSPAGSGEAA